MPAHHRETAAAIEEELNSLRRRHAEALTNATFVGMTPGEANEHNDLLDKIRALIQQLAVLQTATDGPLFLVERGEGMTDKLDGPPEG